MVSAYLLTIAITVVTALHYISVIRPFAYEIPVLSVVAMLLLGTLHWVGVRELPRVALAMAIAALACEAALVVGGAGAGAEASLAGVLDQPQGHGRAALDRDGDRVRGGVAGVLGPGVAGAAGARAARAAAARAAHRGGAGGRQPGGDGADVHGHRGRGGAGERDRPAPRAAGGRRAGLRRAGAADRGVADGRRVPAGRRQRRLHRLLQRLQGGRRARLPAGGAGGAPQALRDAARARSS